MQRGIRATLTTVSRENASIRARSEPRSTDRVRVAMSSLGDRRGDAARARRGCRGVPGRDAGCGDVSARGGRLRPRRSAGGVQASRGSDRIRSSAMLKLSAHGHRAGSRSVQRRLRLTSRPGIASSRVRMVRGDGELLGGVDVAESGGPADEVVGQHGAAEPGGVGEEPARWAVLEAGAFFEVADGQLDGGVVTVELVGGDGAELDVGDERVVPPVGPKSQLVRVGEPGAAHDQAYLSLGSLGGTAAGHVGRLGDLGLSLVGIGDVDPVGLVDRRDRLADAGVHVHRDRPRHFEPVEGLDQLPAEEPGVGPDGQRASGAGAADTGDEFFDEPLRAPLGIGGALAEPGVQDLAGVGSGGQQGVVAELAGVAVGGALFGLAVHLTDRRIQIDCHRPVAWADPEAPRTPDRLGDHRVELADMPEGEGPQERAQRGGRHHLERQHLARRARPQLVGVIDVRPASEDRRHQREHLAARQRTTDPARQPHRLIDQLLQTQAHHHSRRHDQPGVRHQRLVVEGHLESVDRARYSTHWKCLPGWDDDWL